MGIDHYPDRQMVHHRRGEGCLAGRVHRASPDTGASADAGRKRPAAQTIDRDGNIGFRAWGSYHASGIPGSRHEPQANSSALTQLGGLAALGVAAAPAAARAAGAARTPSQIEGPFYPVDKPRDRDWDLLHRGAGGARAAGEPLAFGGRVLDITGRPVDGATIQIWQADNNGIYDHPHAPGRSGFDPAFQGYGTVRTDARGRYRFLTIVPVPYDGRPPHIHAKVSGPGRPELTTRSISRDIPTMSGTGCCRGCPGAAGTR